MPYVKINSSLTTKFVYEFILINWYVEEEDLISFNDFKLLDWVFRQLLVNTLHYNQIGLFSLFVRYSSASYFKPDKRPPSPGEQTRLNLTKNIKKLYTLIILLSYFSLICLLIKFVRSICILKERNEGLFYMCMILWWQND